MHFKCASLVPREQVKSNRCVFLCIVKNLLFSAVQNFNIFHFAVCKEYAFKYYLVCQALSTYGLKLKILFRYRFFMQMNELLEINNVFVCKQNACLA